MQHRHIKNCVRSYKSDMFLCLHSPGGQLEFDAHTSSIIEIRAIQIVHVAGEFIVDRKYIAAVE